MALIFEHQHLYPIGERMGFDLELLRVGDKGGAQQDSNQAKRSREARHPARPLTRFGARRD